jgi:prepilin-type N-terminal cleavage/methylation domain-containing protein
MLSHGRLRYRGGCTATPYGFTLVELMVAVSILSIGIVMVARSFLMATSVLDSSRNSLEAIKFLEEQVAWLIQLEHEEGGVEEGGSTEQVFLGGRPAEWSLEMVLAEPPIESEVTDVVAEDPTGGVDEEEETRVFTEDLIEATLRLSWREGHRDTSESWVTYLDLKKPKEEDGAEGEFGEVVGEERGSNETL